jgi:hypothetical protein
MMQVIKMTEERESLGKTLWESIKSTMIIMTIGGIGYFFGYAKGGLDEMIDQHAAIREKEKEKKVIPWSSCVKYDREKGLVTYDREKCAIKPGAEDPSFLEDEIFYVPKHLEAGLEGTLVK